MHYTHFVLGFAFTLLANVLACAQAVAQEQVLLDAASDQGTFKVEITWIPDDIGSANTFEIRFIEPETVVEIEDVVYDFSIYSGDYREVLRRDQTATRQEFTFDGPGSYQIRIDDIEGLGERVLLPIEVTPEFPNGALVVVAAALAVVLLTGLRKFNTNNLFR